MVLIKILFLAKVIFQYCKLHLYLRVRKVVLLNFRSQLHDVIRARSNRKKKEKIIRFNREITYYQLAFKNHVVLYQKKTSKLELRWRESFKIKDLWWYSWCIIHLKTVKWQKNKWDISLFSSSSLTIASSFLIIRKDLNSPSFFPHFFHLILSQ